MRPKLSYARPEYSVVAFLLLWSAVLMVCSLLLLHSADYGLLGGDVVTQTQPVVTQTQPPVGEVVKPTPQPQLHNLKLDVKETNIVEELYRTVSSDRLKKLASTHHEHYKQASPFPHIAIDNIFSDSLLQKVIEEHPESSLGIDGCLIESLSCFNQTTQKLKSAVTKEELMGTYTRVFFSFLKSSMFISFLEELTGIKYIIADPHFRGSGLHFTAPGGNLNIHADFNKYNEFKLDRRVNVFIYLNNDWPDEYGGHLDLWSRDMKTCYERIAPKLGRFVVFSSTDFSYHGHPEPIAAPKGRARRSMALYYYTNGRPNEECLENDCNGNAHSTLFQKPVGCKKCLDDTCRRETTLSPPTWMADFS